MTILKSKTAKWFGMSMLAMTILSPITANAKEIFGRAQTAAQLDDVYFIAQLKINDMEKFQKEYFPGTSVLLNDTKALVLAVSPQPQIVEGEWDSNWTVLMRFDNQEDFDNFYQKTEYQNKLVPLRQAATSVNNIILLPAFDPSKM